MGCSATGKENHCRIRYSLLFIILKTAFERNWFSFYDFNTQMQILYPCILFYALKYVFSEKSTIFNRPADLSVVLQESFRNPGQCCHCISVLMDHEQSSPYYFVLFPTHAQPAHKLSHSYMFRHYCVILRELVVGTLPSYTSISNAAAGNTI